MKYLIMLLMVLGLAGADFLTGLMKAYIQNDLCSRKMRTGGINKLCELLIMAVACGLEAGIGWLGMWYPQGEAMARLVGTVAASTVFVYIALMEIISIFENYAAISPDAVWVRNIIRRLRHFGEKED